MSETSYVGYDKNTDAMYVENDRGELVLTTAPAQPTAETRHTAIEPRREQQPAIQEQAPIALDVAGIQRGNTLGRSYSDRAKGFNIKISLLAAMLGLLSIIAAVALFDVPFLSWSILIWFWTTFGVTWLIAYLVNELTSPDTITLLGTLGVLNEIRQHRLEQNKRYWNDRQ